MFTQLQSDSFILFLQYDFAFVENYTHICIEWTCNTGDLGLIPGLGRSPGGGSGNPLQYSGLENPHGQRSQAGYRPWGRKESDTIEQLHFHFLCAQMFSLVAQMVKNLPAMRETWVQSLGWEDPLEKEMATHSSILAWRIPMDGGAWRATVHGGHKESDMTE